VTPDLRPVVLDRAARPLVKPEVGRWHPDLPGDERDRVVIQLGPAPREPARLGVELQQQREPQPGRPALPGDQFPFVLEQGPLVDQLVQSISTATLSRDPRLTIVAGPTKVPGMAGGGTSRTTARVLPEAAACGADPEPRKCRLRTSKRNFAGSSTLSSSPSDSNSSWISARMASVGDTRGATGVGLLREWSALRGDLRPLRVYTRDLTPPYLDD
jgi:hypothetical protein